MEIRLHLSADMGNSTIQPWSDSDVELLRVDKTARTWSMFSRRGLPPNTRGHGDGPATPMKIKPSRPRAAQPRIFILLFVPYLQHLMRNYGVTLFWTCSIVSGKLDALLASLRNVWRCGLAVLDVLDQMDLLFP